MPLTRGGCRGVSFRFVLGSDSLVISEVTESDEGLYTCIVNTTLDHVSASAELTVVGRFPPLHTDLLSAAPSAERRAAAPQPPARLPFALTGMGICPQRLIFDDVLPPTPPRPPTPQP